MSLQRARYIHVQTRGGFRNGFSAQISPMPDLPRPTTGMCYFRITFCNSTDAFCRREARVALELKQWQEVRIVDVPKLLAEADESCRTGIHFKRSPKVMQWYSNQYAWVWKYFL